MIHIVSSVVCKLVWEIKIYIHVCSRFFINQSSWWWTLKSSAVLTHGHAGHNCFFFNVWTCTHFVGSTNNNKYIAYSKYLLNFIEFDSFIPGSGCVDMAYKTALFKRTSMFMYMYNYLSSTKNNDIIKFCPTIYFQINGWENKWKINGFVVRNITIDVHFLSISKKMVPQCTI
jgi:hypothetical protein